MTDITVEVWLRGPITGIPSVLQPVAHAILQAKEEIHSLLQNFPDHLLWEKPYGVASVAFHLQHIPGVLDRLTTYADGGHLQPSQVEYLSKEGQHNAELSKLHLLNALNSQIDRFVMMLHSVDPETVLQIRTVGRKMLPSTQLGLLVHCAEHTMRHTGQLHVTVKVLLGSTTSNS